MDMQEDVSDAVAIKKAGESIKVLVRVRPMTDSDVDSHAQTVIDMVDNSSLTVSGGGANKNFHCAFDSVLGPSSTQKEVYSIVKGCTACVLDGFNSTIFAYGQTGSGKTHSMYGPPVTEQAAAVLATTNLHHAPSSSATRDADMVGLIPRAINEIFQMIYNENLFDMLRDPSMGSPLSIREERKGEIYVQGLSEYNIKSVNDTLALLKVAEENRAIRETHMNQFSSRSHSIFQIFVEQKRIAPDGGEKTLKSKFNLVDLAGSEKWSKSAMKDEHIAEMTNINLSLHTLGRCISSLAKKSHGKDAHIPYRESKLTRILQDSLGGNAKTFLIATVSPSSLNVDETVSTLKFADRAKQVMVQATINETRPMDHALVQRLQREIEQLKGLLSQYQMSGGPPVAADQFDGDPYVQPHHIGYVNATAAAPSFAESVALQQAKERCSFLEKDNEKLRRELQRFVGDSSVSSTVGQSRSGNYSPVTDSSQMNSSNNGGKRGLSLSVEQTESAMHAFDSVMEQNTQLWLQVDALQNTARKFFNFDMEEDQFKRLIQKKLRKDVGSQSNPGSNFETAVQQILSPARSVTKQQQHQPHQTVNQQNLPPQYQQKVAQQQTQSQQEVQHHQQHKPIQQQQHHQQQQQPNRQHNQQQPAAAQQKQAPPVKSKKQIQAEMRAMASAQGNSSRPDPPVTETLRSETADRYNGLKPTPPVQSLTSDKSLPRMHRRRGSSPLVTPADVSPSFSNPQSQYSNNEEMFDGRASLPKIVQSKGSPSKKGKVDLAMSGGNAPMSVPSPLSNVAFRVRGSVSNGSAESVSSSWSNMVNEEEEEKRLQEDVRKAKKKLAKQQKMKNWQAEKEQKAREKLHNEEADKIAQDELEREKEAKRQIRAMKQKQKIGEYKHMVKSEADTIQELIALGIDPASLTG